MKIKKPYTAVWEITMGCNMRCMHCGSACEEALEDELTTKEALQVCDEIGRLGLKWITLSGGEPTTRKDWDLIARKLGENNVIVNIITNGWLFDELMAIRAKSAGVNTIAFSLDGLKTTHDGIRKSGSYDKIMTAIDHVVNNGLSCAIITTVNNQNIKELDAMYEVLAQKKIYSWQIQIGLPMGTMAKNKNLVGKPILIDEIIDFAHRHVEDDSIYIHLADCIGYFNQKENDVRKKVRRAFRNKNPDVYDWQGCHAGKRSYGILHNGDVIGCTSVRDREFIEGNIRERPLKEIWEDPNLFAWCREMSKDKLKGTCKKCIYGNVCLGGCPNTRLAMEGSVYAENKYCSYNNVLTAKKKDIEKMSNNKNLYKKALKMVNEGSFQLAEILLEKFIKSKGYDYDVYALYGFVAFKLENYRDAEEINLELIKQNPKDEYSNKGYGLTIAKLGRVDEGLAFLNKAIEYSNGEYTDAYFDSAVVLYENNRCDEALAIIEKARLLSEEYRIKSEDFYRHLLIINGKKIENVVMV